MYLENNVLYEFVVSCRVSNLKFMDWFIRDHIGDEDLFDEWLSEGVPDGASDEDYMDIAAETEAYNDIISVFGAVIERSARE